MKITAIILLMVTLALAGQAVALNNTICPVSQAKIGNMGKPVTVTYKEKLCNSAALGVFQHSQKIPKNT